MEQIVSSQIAVPPVSPSPAQLSFSWLAKESLAQFFGHFGYIVRFTLIQAGITLLAAIPGIIGYALYQANSSLVILSVILFIISAVAMIWAGLVLIAAYYLMIWSTTNANPESIRDLLSQGRGLALKIYFSNLLAVLITALGYLLLIIPGIVFSIWYAFINPVIVDRGSGTDALKASKDLVRGHFKKLLAYFGLGIVLFVVYSTITGLIRSYLPTPEIVSTIIKLILDWPMGTVATLFVFNLYKALNSQS